MDSPEMIFSTVEGQFKVWGGKGRDTFATLNGGDGYLQVMDIEVGDKIQFLWICIYPY